MSDKKQVEITMEELSKHRADGDLWLSIHGNVYLVPKNFLEDHPGGPESIQNQAGLDATDAFEDQSHSEKARAMLANFKIGTIKDYKPKRNYSEKTGSVKNAESSGVSSVLYLIPAVIIFLALVYTFVLSE